MKPGNTHAGGADGERAAVGNREKSYLNMTVPPPPRNEIGKGGGGGVTGVGKEPHEERGDGMKGQVLHRSGEHLP